MCVFDCFTVVFQSTQSFNINHFFKLNHFTTTTILKFSNLSKNLEFFLFPKNRTRKSNHFEIEQKKKIEESLFHLANAKCSQSRNYEEMENAFIFCFLVSNPDNFTVSSKNFSKKLNSEIPNHSFKTIQISIFTYTEEKKN